MKYKVRKTGNSLGITIPIFVTKSLGLKNGTEVTIEMQGKKIIIRKEKTNEETI